MFPKILSAHPLMFYPAAVKRVEELTRLNPNSKFRFIILGHNDKGGWFTGMWDIGIVLK